MCAKLNSSQELAELWFIIQNSVLYMHERRILSVASRWPVTGRFRFHGIGNALPHVPMKTTDVLIARSKVSSFFVS
jgi:hypothetical protein